MGHIHADKMAQYAEDAKGTAEPWKLWEIKFKHQKSWSNMGYTPNWHPDIEYRRKPDTITINGHQVPKPVTAVEFVELSEAYIFDLVGNTHKQVGGLDAFVVHCLSIGVVHRTKEGAEQHRRALLSFTNG